ncbi:MAG TPA: hypothetical protein VMA75_04860, partial [Candidatus Paceibacterota bacterium]|nr:hypothetical protein [Candidatus Paceibacterota bacterium]
KEWIWGALLGLLLLAGAYLILNVINPQLVNLNLPTLNSVTVANSSLLSNTTGNVPVTPSTSACAAPTTGGCTVANLQNSCFSSNPTLWAGICGHESGGAATVKSGSDYCLGPTGSGNYSVSIGLFQINITNSWNQTVDGQNCSAAFTGQAISCSGGGPCTTGHNGSGSACQISSGNCGSVSCMQLYNDCVSAAQVAASNISAACQLSSNGGNTGPWKADATACGY